MIITDLMEFDGKEVTVKLTDLTEYTGKLEYIPSYSEMYGWRRAHYFYIGEHSFRCHYVLECTEIKPL